MKITLYGYWRSSCSWRVRWALLHKGLPFETKPVNLLKAEQRSQNFLDINPSGKVPALKMNGDLFTNSLAIIEYLDEMYPLNPLLPSSAKEKSVVRELSYIIAMDTQPIGNLSVLHRHSQDEEERKNWARDFNRQGLSSFEKMRARHGITSNYSFSPQLTMADLCLIPQCYNALRFGVKLETEFPSLFEIYQRCLSLTNCFKSAPEQQLDAVIN